MLTSRGYEAQVIAFNFSIINPHIVHNALACHARGKA
jgi:hypothetical protein